MQTIGAVRNIDKQGRIVLPKDMRDILDMEIGARVVVRVEGDRLILEKYNAEEAVSRTLDVLERQLEEIGMLEELKDSVNSIRVEIE